MRYRFTFFAGLAVGFIVGARAGRERYEQMKKLARKAADSPAMQQAAGAAQAQAAGLAKSAKDKAMERVPRLTEKAKNTVAPLGERVPGSGRVKPTATLKVARTAARPAPREQAASHLAGHRRWPEASPAGPLAGYSAGGPSGVPGDLIHRP